MESKVEYGLTWEATMSLKRYPILFSFNETILGHGFVAGVSVHGRATAEQEQAWWIYGVNPGGIAECGDSLHDAVSGFRQRFKTVLFDCASEATDFDSFRQDVETFFMTRETAIVNEWESARQQMRSDRVTLESLPRVTAATQPLIEVVKLEISPGANRLDDESHSLAA